MFTIHLGINGGWYGSVTAETSEDALSEARELGALLAQLKADHPKPSRAMPEVPPPGLNEAGLACLAFCRANPRCTHAEYSNAGHTLRTVKWLRERGYLRDVNGAWMINESP